MNFLKRLLFAFAITAAGSVLRELLKTPREITPQLDDIDTKRNPQEQNIRQEEYLH